MADEKTVVENEEELHIDDENENGDSPNAGGDADADVEVDEEEDVDEDKDGGVSKGTDPQSPEEQLAAEKAKNAKLAKANKKLFARAKTAEDKDKKKKPADNSVDDVDKIAFFSQSSLSLVEKKANYAQIQAIMKGKGISFEEAQKDPLYTAFVEKQTKEKRDEQAQLDGSRGSFNSTKSDFKPGMSEEDHKKAWDKEHQQ
jgi:hypothetical protein